MGVGAVLIEQKILIDLKKIGTSSPYHWIDYYISDWYQRGWGGEEKKNQAVKWSERAAHKGNTSAMYNLGNYYSYGELGVTQSCTKANELYALAADKGHSIARLNLGQSYRIGRGDLAIDFNRCVELWTQSAKQGVVFAQTALAEMYSTGWDSPPPPSSYYTAPIPANPQLAFRWHLAAAKQGCMPSMLILGNLYFVGDGVERNLESALEWYLKTVDMDMGMGAYSSNNALFTSSYIM